ncbi:MAG: carbon starvation CstA family protein [Acidobacteriota bacterium]
MSSWMMPRRLMTILLVVLAVLGACALAVVTRLLPTGERVNGLWLVVAAGCLFVVAYRTYGAFMAAKVLALDDRRITPARRVADGRDYHATNKWVLFGHHFAAIAGAGPLIGPVLAAQFGYLPGFLWILIGAVFAGAVHDFVVLVASVRRNGCSLAEIARTEVGPVSGFAGSIAVIFIIIVTLAGLGLAVVNALAESAWGTFIIGMSIPIALLMGQYLCRIRLGKVGETTVLGVALLLAAVFFGHYVPGSWAEPFFHLSRNGVNIAMVIYGFGASVLPVWMLLCPRDYLSTYMKVGTVVFLAIGTILLAPQIRMPAVTVFADGDGPVLPGSIFPFMFITIACGAISGFHSLISSGTTPKMVSNESETHAIGFGAMLLEGFVAVMALVAASILIPGDYFAINSDLPFDRLAALGFPVSRVDELSRLVGTNVAHRPGGAVSLAVGMASIFSSLPGMRGLMAYWYNFALMFEALFILTTVDTGTRVARFLLQELGGSVYKPLKRHAWMPGTLLTSGIVVAAWGYLIHSGSIKTIWPMFGIANQLLATLGLSVGTTVLIKMGKPRYAVTTFVPMLFMVATTFTAAIQLIERFLRYAADPAKAAMSFTHRLDAMLVAGMLLLAVTILLDSFYKWYGFLTGRRRIVLREYTPGAAAVREE